MTGDEFRKARLKLGLTQAQIAIDLGVHDGRTVRRWEAGERAIPGGVEITLAYWLRDQKAGSERIAFN